MVVEVATQLVQWARIKAEIAECKDITVMGKMNYSLESIQRWAKLSKQSLETQNEIAEYRLRLNRKQGEWIEANIPEDGGNPQLTKISRLEDAGINRNDSPKFRALARLPERRIEVYIKAAKEEGREITTNDICRLYTKNIATKWTGDQENYTPEIYIEAVRAVLGSIDCDPASNELAQRVIRAKTYFTKEMDGLEQEWYGSIFLNPPYSHPEVAQFVDKLLEELDFGSTTKAILLTNNNTDTQFFHKAARRADAICFTKGRINFYKAEGTMTQPTNGQVFFYFGNDTDIFSDIFSEFGIIMKVI